MSDFVRFALPNGGHLLVEMDGTAQPDTELPERDMGLFEGRSRVQEARQSLTESLQTFIPAADALLHQHRALQPDELTIEMGITLSAEFGIAITKAGCTGHLQVTLAWRREAVAQ